MKIDESKLEKYPFTIRPLRADEGGGYLIEYPDVPGCMSDGETPEEAMRNGRDALKGCLETLQEIGDRIPRPGSTGSSGQWRQRVPKSIHARLAARAAEEGVSLNSLVTAMVSEGLGRRDARRPGEGRSYESVTVGQTPKHRAAIKIVKGSKKEKRQHRKGTASVPRG